MGGIKICNVAGSPEYTPYPELGPPATTTSRAKYMRIFAHRKLDAPKGALLLQLGRLRACDIFGFQSYLPRGAPLETSGPGMSK